VSESVCDIMLRSLCSFVVVLCMSVLLVGLAQSCGVTQHNAIGHRALAFIRNSSNNNTLSNAFLQMIQVQQEAFQPGLAFPDWGYVVVGGGGGGGGGMVLLWIDHCDMHQLPMHHILTVWYAV
jgi:hypothetical protein